MIPPPSFELASTPLENGVTLIEASAGTGKTFTIAGLFLRLLLERDLSVREILVVTFTEAATEELRDRIRRTLTDAASAFRSGAAPGSSLEGMIAPHIARAAEMLARLDLALSGFDEAPIFTIHGFCQRTLKDRAFESGVLFDTELLQDDTPLLQEVADDFWRRQFYEAPALEVSSVADKLNPEVLLGLLREHLRHPQMKVLSTLSNGELHEAARQLHAAFDAASRLWHSGRESILAECSPAGGWAKGDHNKAVLMAEQARLVDLCFATAGPTPESLDALDFFTTTSLAEDTRKDGNTPHHPFFEHCETVGQRRKNFSTALFLAFLAFSRSELPRRKQQRKIQTFDDLLTRLHAALHGAGGIALASQLRQRYRAALIDEFQDTDPIQYQNFHRIFASGDGRAESLLFLIGDPKQAIYAFRGADIFTYLDAARTADRRFTLDLNWRSESGLVHAVNSVFGQRPDPFLFEAIPFKPVLAAGRADERPLASGADPASLQFWIVPREPGAKKISTRQAESDLPRIVAAEIVRLLDGSARIGGRRVTPRDVAVLVRKKKQARLMQEALQLLRVPAVLHTEESVFESREAVELSRVLSAIAAPFDERRIRAALATDFSGHDGAALDRLSRDDQRWQQTLQQFHDAHALWMERGFTVMFRTWLHRGGVRQRLIAHEDGERRLTNLLHLAELIHQAAQERRLTPEPVVRWLEEQINTAGRGAEENQLRIERDDEAVRLVTIHKSKGLEYPIVFCPFSWGSAEHPGRHGSWINPVFFHRDKSGENHPARSELICDLDSPDRAAHEAIAFRERLAEDLRLLYVALTRARNRCYFVWGAFNRAGASAAAWLLHPERHEAADLEPAMSAHFTALDDAQLRSDLDALAAKANAGRNTPAIHVAEAPTASTTPYLPPLPGERPLAARSFTGRIRRDWRIHSFSALAAGAADESPDYDRAGAPDVVPAGDAPESSGIFAFPRGAAAGTCLHKLFEQLDFAEPDSDRVRKLIVETLATHGFPPETHADAVHDMVRDVLDVPLDPDQPGLCLRRIESAARLNELEFFFPIQRLSPALLASGACAESTAPEAVARLSRLNFQPADGFLKGFIDLVFDWKGKFYLVDWKSNWLGARAEDYDQTAMDREMNAKFYTLQSQLYSVALHQYLALRQPGREFQCHFGGVLYLFVRGIDPQRPWLGVHRHHPEQRSIEKPRPALPPRDPEDPP